MARKIQFKRGLKKNLPTLSPGEMAYTTDEKSAYIGDGAENIRLLDQKDKGELTAQLAEKASKDEVRLKTQKIGQLDVTEEFLQQMAGDTPVNAVPPANGVTSTHLASESATSAKRTAKGEFGVLICLNELIDFNFTENIVKIPATTNLVYKNKYYLSSELTKGQPLSVPMLTNSEMILTFNTKTMLFRVSGTWEIPTSSEDEIVIAIMSRQYSKVAIIGHYKLNGVNPYVTKGELSDVSSLPTYVINDLKATNNKVSQKTAHNKLTFGVISDTHGYLEHVKAMSEMSKYGQMDFVVHGGDIVVNETVIETVRQNFTDTTQVLKTIQEPVFCIRGNHDADDKGELTQGEWYNRMVKPFKQNNIVVNETDPDSGYYYQDFTEHKVRAIFLNTTEIPVYTDSTPANTDYRWGISEIQLRWLATNALNLYGKEGWSVIVFGHHNSRQDYSFSLPMKNGGIMEGILKAFNEGATYVYPEMGINMNFSDFSMQGTIPVIAYIFGHTHHNTMEVPEDLGFPMISAQSSKPDYYASVPTKTQSYPRTLGTDTEDCWDMFVVDFENRTINMYRYGAGIDRTISY